VKNLFGSNSTAVAADTAFKLKTIVFLQVTCHRTPAIRLRRGTSEPIISDCDCWSWIQVQ